MGLFSFLSSTEKAMDTASSLIDGGIRAADALVFTDEEKANMGLKQAEMKFKFIELQHKFVENTLNENSVRSISRRYLAWGIVGLGIFLTILAVCAWQWNEEYANFVLLMLEKWETAIGAVVFFYFGYYGAMGIVSAFKKPNGKKEENGNGNS